MIFWALALLALCASARAANEYALTFTDVDDPSVSCTGTLRFARPDATATDPVSVLTTGSTPDQLLVCDVSTVAELCDAPPCFTNVLARILYINGGLDAGAFFGLSPDGEDPYMAAVAEKDLSTTRLFDTGHQRSFNLQLSSTTLDSPTTSPTPAPSAFPPSPAPTEAPETSPAPTPAPTAGVCPCTTLIASSSQSGDADDRVRVHAHEGEGVVFDTGDSFSGEFHLCSVTMRMATRLPLPDLRKFLSSARLRAYEADDQKALEVELVGRFGAPDLDLLFEVGGDDPLSIEDIVYDDAGLVTEFTLRLSIVQTEFVLSTAGGIKFGLLVTFPQWSLQNTPLWHVQEASQSFTSDSYIWGGERFPTTPERLRNEVVFDVQRYDAKTLNQEVVCANEAPASGYDL